MPISALEIKKKEFEQKMRGYDVDEVRRFLDEVSNEVDTLTRDNISLEEELNETRGKLDHYLKVETSLEKTLLAAQQTAVKMEEQSKKEASLLLEQARLERDKMMNELPLEIERARGEVTRLKAEYESTVARMKSVLEGFSVYISKLEEK